MFQPPSGKRLRAVAHHLSVLQNAPDERVQLEALERRVRIEQRILVAETDDQADRDASRRASHTGSCRRTLPAAADTPAVWMTVPGASAIVRDVPNLFQANARIRGGIAGCRRAAACA